MKSIREGLAPKGRVEIFQTRGKPTLRYGEVISRKAPAGFEGRIPLIHKSCDIDFSNCEIIHKEDIRNIIVNGGKDKIIEAITTGFVNQVARMAAGDRGTIPSDPTQPKIPTEDQTALFNEVFRSDIDATVLDVGITPGVHEVKFIKTFSAIVIPITSFSNQASPVLNEVGLIMADLFGGAPLPRADVEAPNTPDADESLFSIRTFKSVPFEAANEISVTIRYTIFIE